jgi:hypothetical protein
MTRFITLCRCVLLFPQMPLAMLHNRDCNLPSICPCIWGPVLKTRQSLVSFTPYSTLLHGTGLQPRSYAIPTETLESSPCRTRWGRYRLPRHLKIYTIKKVPADLSVPFQNPWSVRSIRRLESLTILLLIIGVLSHIMQPPP